MTLILKDILDIGAVSFKDMVEFKETIESNVKFYNNREVEFGMKGRAKRLETSKELYEEHSNWYSAQNVYLTKEDIDYLLKGGYLSFDDGEYSHGLIYDENGDMDEVL